MRNRFVGGGPKMTRHEQIVWFFAMVAAMVVLFTIVGTIFGPPNQLVSDIIVAVSIIGTYVAQLLIRHRRDHTVR